LQSRLWSLAIVSGLLAGLASWAVTESIKDVVKPDQSQSTNPTERREARFLAEIKNASNAFAAQGALIGLFLGLAGGLSRGSFGRALLGGLIGLVIGAAVTYACYLIGAPAIGGNNTQVHNDLKTSFQFHALGWLPAGLAGGLALGIGLGGVRRALGALTGGLLGAAVGTMLFEVIGAVIPWAETARPVPGVWYGRLAACVVIALAVAACTVVGCTENKTAPTPATPPPAA
jgi:hypothetical protein